MTYEEAIKESIGKIKELDMHPLCVPWLITSLSGIICHGAKYMLKGRHDEPTIDDIVHALCGESFEFIMVQCRIQQFIQWLLDQEIEEPEDEDEGPIWYTTNALADKWNEYADLQKKGESA